MWRRGPDPRSGAGFWLLVLVAVFLFSMPSSASAQDATPSPEPSAAETTEPPAEPDADGEAPTTPDDLPDLTDDGLVPDEEEAVTGEPCGTVDLPCVIALEKDQAEVVAVGAGFALMFIVAHAVASWRLGRD